MPESKLIVESAYRCLNRRGEPINGDNFIFRHIVPERRSVAVLSDGMGHGVKANILSTFTATMLINFLSAHRDITEAAGLILRMLPVNPSYGVSYATFTIADTDHITGEVTVIQHDNPPVIVIRDGIPLNLGWEELRAGGNAKPATALRVTRFNARDGDRIIMASDGVTQSGQRAGLYKFGWGDDQLRQFASYLLSVNSGITVSDIASQIVSKANINDSGHPSDDISCAVVHYRTPRSMMFVSCPPAVSEEHPRLLDIVKGFHGEKIICGHPVAQIISQGFGLPLERNERFSDPVDTPQFTMRGFSLVTEGMIVPNRALDILEHSFSAADISTPDIPGWLCRTFLRYDRIEMIIGLRRTINPDPNTPDEFELRRNILRRIAVLLETKFGKQVRITYL